ncbi:MAG: hypothetical protein LBE61_01670 [Burkholderiaceae bacterium]|jgi:hypothetical protein|nr:hypothetical protein [Burkholderiaceae bacterium]
MKFRLVCCAGIVWLASGCTAVQSTPPAMAGCTTWERQQASGAPSPAVQVLSPELARVIGIRDVLTSRTGSGVAAVQVDVYNCADVDVVLSVRTRFTGERGQSEPPSAWKTVFLPPRGQATYAETAVSQATRKVAVDIHDANRGQTQFAPGQNYAVPLAPSHPPH